MKIPGLKKRVFPAPVLNSSLPLLIARAYPSTPSVQAAVIPAPLRRKTKTSLPARQATMLLALLWLAFRTWQTRPGFGEMGLALVSALLLFMARSLPVFSTRERPVTLLAPITFALTLWTGAFPSALGVLLASLIYARFGSTSGGTRSYTRFQGAQLALSALVTEAFFLSWHVATVTVPKVVGLSAITALLFVACNVLLTFLGREITPRPLLRCLPSQAQMHELLRVYALGLLPVVLLEPLEPNWRLLIAPPFLLLLLLGGQVARLAREVADLQGQLQTAEAMGRASISDIEPLASEALLQRFLTLAQQLVAADQALVWTMNSATGELTPAVGLPDLGKYANQTAVFGEGLIGHAAARLRPRRIANAARDPHRNRHEAASGAWLLYPLIVHEQLLGVAHWTRPTSQPFTSADVARLDSLVPQAAIAFENVRVRGEMHNLAATDGLTGMWNHRRMYELLREEMRRAARYHRALAVLMLDVDSFKTFNDTYGHPQGDRLLRNIATILRGAVRNVDHVGRYGGEEFLIILPETSKDQACRLAERIREAVEERAFVQIGDSVIHRTVSVGVAASPEDALNPAELVQRADEALYRAKRAGKNCVLWA